jgi:hypothetical protein
MLSFTLHMSIGEQDLLLPVAGHIVFTTVAGQGWLAGQKPSLDATLRLAAATYCGNAYASQFFAFSSQGLGVTKPAVQSLLVCCKTPCRLQCDAVQLAAGAGRMASTS